MAPEANQDKFLALLKKTSADIIANWKWPLWRRDEGPSGDADERPKPGA